VLLAISTIACKENYALQQQRSIVGTFMSEEETTAKCKIARENSFLTIGEKHYPINKGDEVEVISIGSKLGSAVNSSADRLMVRIPSSFQKYMTNSSALASLDSKSINCAQPLKVLQLKAAGQRCFKQSGQTLCCDNSGNCYSK